MWLCTGKSGTTRRTQLLTTEHFCHLCWVLSKKIFLYESMIYLFIYLLAKFQARAISRWGRMSLRSLEGLGCSRLRARAVAMHAFSARPGGGKGQLKLTLYAFLSFSLLLIFTDVKGYQFRSLFQLLEERGARPDGRSRWGGYRWTVERFPCWTRKWGPPLWL